MLLVVVGLMDVALPEPVPGLIDVTLPDQINWHLARCTLYTYAGAMNERMGFFVVWIYAGVRSSD